MKKFYAILCLVIASLTQLHAQAPQGFNYQATVRNSSGDLIVNTNVNFKFSITQGSQTPYTAYSEDHTPSTDDLGQVSLVIGQGNPITGIFSDIDWSIGNYYLAIELDTGNGYVAMGTTQLLSVPYALYAENSGNSTPTTPNLEEVLAENNSANNQQIKNLQDPTEAQDAVTLAYVLAQIDQINLNIDHDGDGFSENNGDCDDTNAQVYSGAEEICDGLDNDCDGLVDEDAGSIFYQDSDGDGFGGSTSIQSCEQPSGYVAQSGDCDDSDATINPNAVEVCDGIDNNCNGVVDEGLTSTFYQDSDGDGFGGFTTIQSCTQPSGYVAQGGDCDDSDATINPNAVEVCDGIDNNCNGVVDEGLINIITQPLAEQTVCFGEVPSPLVLDYDNENETPSFQWYSTTTCDTSDTSLPIVGANSSSYTPPSSAVGSFYYFVVLFDGSCTLTSDCALVNINPSAQVNQVDDITVFSGETVSEIVFSTSNTVGTTTYSWTNDNLSTGLNISSAAAGHVPAFTAINASTSPIVCIITVYPFFTSYGGISCEGPSMSFTITVYPTQGSITDQDGNTYDYLTYGNQIWTVENAEMVTYRDGTPIPQVTDNAEWANLSTGAWAYYNNDPTKPRLYNWYAVMGIHDTDPNTPNKEFAPEGWHVPSDAEWTTLEEYLIASGYNYDGTTTGNKIGKAMASTTGWGTSTSTNTGAIGNDQSLNNSSGFNAFPEVIRSNNGSFDVGGYNAIFWSSTEDDPDNAWYRFLNFNSSVLYRYGDYKQVGFSVRFVRD